MKCLIIIMCITLCSCSASRNRTSDVIELKVSPEEDTLKVIIQDVKEDSSHSSISITGQVADSTTGLPLTGSNVVVKGTRIGATAGLWGEFSINGVKKGSTIIISRISYRSKRIVIYDSTSVKTY